MNFGMISLGGDKIFFTFLCLGTPPPWNGFRTRKVKSMCLLVRFNQRALKPPKAGGPLPPLANGQNFPSLFFKTSQAYIYWQERIYRENVFSPKNCKASHGRVLCLRWASCQQEKYWQGTKKVREGEAGGWLQK